MKTEAQLARAELELSAIDSVLGHLRYLGYHPRNGDTWTKYCQALDSYLGYELNRAEYWSKHSSQNFG